MDSGYRAGSSGSGINSSQQAPDDPTAYWSLDKLKKSYLNYLDLKRDEINEQIEARRYRHASQWTAEQIKVFNKRKQPIVTYNREGRKINAVIGLVEKLKQAPKGYPRTLQEDQRGGADLATAVIREILDANEWKMKASIAAEAGATDGMGGLELELVKGDQGDPDIGFNICDPKDCFYDPRSYELDFSDARFLGQAKWVDIDTAIEIAPDMEKEIRNSGNDSDLTSNPDSDQKWFFSDGPDNKRIRLVLEDYKWKGEWCWCLYTGSVKLKEGKSPFHDEKGKSISRYLWFSANVDQDGDRYGFHRNFKGPQDEINMRRSKGLHILNSRGIIAEGGAFDDIEVARVEAARPDMVLQPNPGKKVEFDDTSRVTNLEGQLKFLEDARLEIDSFGPNPQLSGQGITKDQSGRAIQLLQQAGIAELGPFIIAYRGWKIRLYRSLWNAAREHWTAERAIRITDDERVVDFIKVNSVGLDQMGMPTMVNTLGQLDVDIILDEGPDSINVIQDTHDALMALAQSGAEIPPDILLEFMPGLDSQTKKRLQERLEQAKQPGPEQQLQMQELQGKVAQLMADAELKKAQTAKAYHDAQMPPEGMMGGGEQQHPSMMMAEIQEKMASATLKHTQSQKAQADTEKSFADRAKVLQDIQLEPARMAMEQQNAQADRAQQAQDSARNAKINEMKAKQKPAPRAA